MDNHPDIAIQDNLFFPDTGKEAPGFTRSLLAVFFLLFFACSGTDMDTKIITLQTDDPSSIAIRLVNNGNTPVRLMLKFNGGCFFSTVKEILDTVAGMPEDLPGEPPYRKAWRFLARHIHSSYPLTKDEWYHSPLLLFNSPGFGYCDDKATALASLWKEMGYDSRIWYLGGHSVPEVFTGDGWEMYDPSRNVCYLTATGKPASVEDIITDNAVFSKPYFCGNSFYSLLYDLMKENEKKLFLSTGNNRITATPGMDDTGLFFEIPSRALFEFPVRYYHEIMSGDSTKIPVYETARILLPPAPAQSVAVPLVLISATGNGIIGLNNEKYNIGSDECREMIRKQQQFNYRIAVNNPEDTVIITYLINPSLIKLKTANTIYISGMNCRNISAAIFDLPFSAKPRTFLFDSLVDCRKGIALLDKIRQNQSNTISDTASLFLLADEYLSSDPFLTPNEKNKNSLRIRSCTRKIVTALDKEESVKLFTMMDKNINLIYLYIAMAGRGEIPIKSATIRKFINGITQET
ncbi:MAG: transglutaminase domain-containing protein [Bacteroidetes bacterium]|nr:transglutaminase domain-containing protein [Bacteroidota bacterium]